MRITQLRKLWRRLAMMAGYFPRILKLIWDADPRYALLAVIFGITGALAPGAQIWMTKVVIDRIVENIGPLASGAPDWPSILAPMGFVFFVWVVGSICQSISLSVRELLGFRVRIHAESLLLKKVAGLDIAFFDTPEFYDKMESARQENNRAHNLAYFCLDLFSEILTLGLMLGLLSRLHPMAVVLLLFTSAPQVIISGYYTNKVFDLDMGRTASKRMAAYMSELLSARAAVKEIRHFRLQDELLVRFLRYWKDFLDEFDKLFFSKEFASVLSGLLSMSGTALIWGYAVVQGVLGRIPVGDVALAFQAAEQSRNGISRLFQITGALYEHTLYASKFFSVLDLRPDSVEGSLARGQSESGRPSPVPQPIKQGIEFRNVSFRYPNSDRFALKGVSLHIKAGESLAVVGENGAGKTTFINLLTRLYDPTEGEIYLDGRDLKEYDPDELHNELGVIFQDFVHYNLTAEENIGIGHLNFISDQGRILQAAQKGGALPLLEKLPFGLKTILGKRFDGGVDISGGEWQKLALSRAFMGDKQILILDEPTAALDALAELDVYRRFSELTKGKTTIFISHRFSTVRMANHIMVLDDGQLIEEGGHDQLMNLDRRYAMMFNAQADRYK